MKTPTPKVRTAYKNLCANLVEYERLVLALMRHPDATPQQMVDSGSGYRMIWDSWWRARTKLREKYPQKGQPWS